MRYRKLDSNHDMCFGNGIKDYLEDSVNNPDAVAQAIQTRLLLFYGEWWENITDGIPMWQQVLGQRIADKTIVDKIIVDNIMGLKLPDPDNRYAVIRVVSVDSVHDTEKREYTFAGVVDTLYGEVVVTNASQEGGS